MSQQKINTNDIDENLYSRQLYVLGHDAMRKMQLSNVLISGMGGLGIEIAKNVVLAGVKSVTIHDQINTSYDDLATQFFLSELDIGKNRAECTFAHLADLNPYVPITIHTGELTENFLKNFQVVALTNMAHGEQLKIGNFCHTNGIKLVSAETRGIFGKIFCDFGKRFEVLDVDGRNPSSTMICNITNDVHGVVTTLDETRHGFEDGWFVRFEQVNGMTDVNGREFEIKVLGPYQFSIGDTSAFGAYKGGGVAEEIKKPKFIDFAPISEAQFRPDYVISDFKKMTDNDTIHVAFQAIWQFEDQYECSPKPWDKNDSEIFAAIANDTNGKLNKPFENLNQDLLRLFSAVSAGSISPVESVIGGVCAQEIMKACSGKFHPICQYFYFDCREALPTNRPFDVLRTESCTLDDSDSITLKRYQAQINVFGKAFQEKLLGLKFFIVGSGALGCEYLKNFAMIGIGSGTYGGLITLTDMDTIEKSNLNRQFLFRSHDVGKSKALVASNAVRRMNPHLTIEPHLNRIAVETENVYNDGFFESLDGVCNALDNVAARNYVDSRCVYYRKPLIESGTLGTQGNVQCILPFLTESYSSTQDPPEKFIPICTLKNFPNLIEHTLQWARDMFEGLFANTSSCCMDYLKDPIAYVQRIGKMHDSEALGELTKVYETLHVDRPKTFADCIKWARNQWQESFCNIIVQLLYNFPPDQVTSSGVPFWSGPKRCPSPLDFDTNNRLHCDYVHAAANLRAYMFDIEQCRDLDACVDMMKAVVVDKFEPKSGIRIQVDESEGHTNDDQGVDRDRIVELIEKLERAQQVAHCDLILKPVEFEKDDDTNFHMDFIVACSNLRAENYGIKPADRHKSKLIAGRIIPAIATTTATIVGLDCIEVYKLAQGHTDLELYKNSFINLALPFFSSSEPVQAKTAKYNETEFTLWDFFDIDHDMSLDEFLSFFKTKYNMTVTIVSYGVIVLYADFMNKTKVQERLGLKISDIIESMTKQKLPDHVKTLKLEICGSDINGVDLEVPYVRYRLC